MPKETFYTSMNETVFKTIFFDSETKSAEFLKFIIEKTLGKEIEIVKAFKQGNGKNTFGEYEGGIFVETPEDLIEVIVNSNENENSIFNNIKRKWRRYQAEADNADKNYIQINITEGLSEDIPSFEEYKLHRKSDCKEVFENFVIYEYNIDKILKEVKSSEDDYAFIAMLKSDKANLNKICKGNEIMEKYQKEVERLNKDLEFLKKVMANEKDPQVINLSINIDC